MREVSVRLLDTGYCLHPQVMTLRHGSLKPAAFPVLAALLMHPSEGPILFDTGYDRAFLQATAPFPEHLYRWLAPARFAPAQAAAHQLQTLGVAPDSVRHLILSHFHADHIAGTRRFPRARIHCAKAGHLVACKGRIPALRRGILPALLPADFAARARYFEEGKTATLPSDLAPFSDGMDVLGDGSLIAVELPGHCPGHWGLVVRDSAVGLHFLVADAAWSSAAIRQNAPPPRITSAFLGDTNRGSATLAALHALWRQNPEITITPSHCQERAATCQPS